MPIQWRKFRQNDNIFISVLWHTTKLCYGNILKHTQVTAHIQHRYLNVFPTGHISLMKYEFHHKAWFTAIQNNYTHTTRIWMRQCVFMMTSSNGNIFRVTGHLCGEFTGHRWIPHTQRPVTRSFDIFCDLRLNKRLSKQSWGWWFETP